MRSLSRLLRFRRLALLTWLLPLALGACGFQLRGQASLPFETLFISAPQQSLLASDLKRALRVGSGTRTVDSAEQAQAVLEITSENTEKTILSLGGAGRVTDYLLRYRVRFRLSDRAGKTLIPAGEIVLRREQSYDAAQVLAKEAEEVQLFRDMRGDAAQQLLRRLAALGAS